MPRPPNAAWLMPPLMNTSRLTTTKVPTMPQRTLASRPATSAWRTNSKANRWLTLTLTARSLVRVMLEHAVRHAVGDELDRAAVDLLELLRRDTALGVVVQAPVHAGDLAHDAGERRQVVGDDDDRHRRMQVAQDVDEHLAVAGVDRGERLVEQQHLGLADERAGDEG